MNTAIRAVIVGTIVSFSACTAVKPPISEREAVKKAWHLMENEQIEESIRLIRPYLQTKNPELALAIGHLFNGRAINGNAEQVELRKQDQQCFIAMLEHSAVLGSFNAASTLSNTFHFWEKYIPKDKDKSDCWMRAFEGADAAKCVDSEVKSACGKH